MSQFLGGTRSPSDLVVEPKPFRDRLSLAMNRTDAEVPAVIRPPAGQLVEVHLADVGYAVRQPRDGREALEQIAAEEQPDLVVHPRE